MMINKIEKKYLKAIQNQAVVQEKIYNELIDDYDFKLNELEVTVAILNRLKTYYDTHNKIKRFLNKRYVTPAADFFVEQVIFFIKLFLEKQRPNFFAHSERQIRKRRGMIRPDISIWNDNDNVVAIIECKTQLGWNRKNWKTDFLVREEKLHKEFPKSKAYLLVMTTGNWGGFSQDNLQIGKKYFSLLNNVWPGDLDINELENKILTPFEKLLDEILTL